MLVHPWDAASEDEAWEVLRAQGFGQLVAGGREREVPVVVPTQYVVVEGPAGDRDVLLHLARPNPVWAAVAENPSVLLAVAGDWTYVPAAWQAVGKEEDPALGIPTTYYAAVQVLATAHVLDEPADTLRVLRAQLAEFEPGPGVADPAVHERRLAGIRGMRLQVHRVTGKLKYGGNVDAAHREAVAARLAERAGPGDAAALAHLVSSLRSREVASPGAPS